MKVSNGPHQLNSSGGNMRFTATNSGGTTTFECPPDGGYTYDAAKDLYVATKTNTVLRFNDDGTFYWWWTDAPPPMPQAGQGTWS